MRNVLIVVDMQKDFIDGSLGSSDALAIVPAVMKAAADPGYDAIYATLDTHPDNYLETFEGEHLPVVHCIRNTEGWKLWPPLAERLAERQAVLVEKPTFGSVRLAEEIAAGHPESITLCGLCTDICVASNALLLRAYLPDTRIAVIADACAGTTPLKHKETLDVLASCQIEIAEISGGQENEQD